MEKIIVECNAQGHHQIANKLMEMTGAETEFEGFERSIEESTKLNEMLSEVYDSSYDSSYSEIYVDESTSANGNRLFDEVCKYLESEECTKMGINIVTEEEVKEHIEQCKNDIEYEME